MLEELFLKIVTINPKAKIHVEALKDLREMEPDEFVLEMIEARLNAILTLENEEMATIAMVGAFLGVFI